MKKVWSQLFLYANEDFNLKFYCYVIFVLFTSICINYTFGFEDRVIGSALNTPFIFLYYFIFYSFAYFSIAIPQSLFLNGNFIRQKEFWVKSIFFLLLLAINGGFYFHKSIVQKITSLTYDESYLLHNLMINVYPMFIYLPCLLLIKFIYDRPSSEFYGLGFIKFNYQPYIIFLLIMLPLIVFASFQKDFQDIYPQIRPWELSTCFGMNPWMSSGIFEFFYLMDFVWVELLFRGAMVIGLVSIMGRHAILPMVVTYAFLHFGKPLGETIGAIVGGYILGVIALYSRNIVGGILIHLGVAFLMEVCALLHYYLLRS